MSKSVPDLEQALALTSRGARPAACRAPRCPSSPRDDRHPRRSGGSGPVAGDSPTSRRSRSAAWSAPGLNAVFAQHHKPEIAR